MSKEQRSWDNSELFVMNSLQNIHAQLNEITHRLEDNTRNLAVIDKELKLRSTIYGALGSVVVAVVLKLAFGD